MTDLARSSSDVFSIYAWDKRLETYLRENAGKVTSQMAYRAYLEAGSIFSIETPEEEWRLALSEEELICARIWLWSEGLYRYSDRLSEFTYSINTRKISEILYRNTLFGESKKPQYDELCFGAAIRYRREYPGVNVRVSDGYESTEQHLQLHMTFLRSLKELNGFSIGPRADVVKSLKYPTKDLRKAGRYRTPKASQVVAMLDESAKFIDWHGEHLTNSFINVAVTAKNLGIGVYELASDAAFPDVLDSRTRKLGVRHWSLLQAVTKKEANRGWRPREYVQPSDFFARLRDNEGLTELLQVLYGAGICHLGSMSARRQEELFELKLESCIDGIGQYLIFENGKSGGLGEREINMRPIPPSCVNFVGLVDTLQSDLVSFGVITHKTFLLSIPTADGRLRSSKRTYEQAIDIFLDYTSSPLYDGVRRFYLRNHQLRRVFAIWFFYGTDYGRLDTLRWFLGHVSLKHLYHYITDAMDGEMLLWVKANFLGHKLTEEREADDSYERLGDIVAERFAHRNFALMDCDALEDYLKHLLKEGRVVVEPEFFRTQDGEQYRILVSVRDRK
ncbi:hypothetical protein PQR53_31745 [Paraburkholderia fungorum]|uniref:hypothetical protein n=1 Tax=Paraburkholderia fungorum TaxID=134537 RepID=UPI0038BB46E9